MLASRGRLQLLIRPERWFANLFEVPGVRQADICMDADRVILSARQAAEGSGIDRIIAATARLLGATLVTRDRALLAYGEQGHVAVLEC